MSQWLFIINEKIHGAGVSPAIPAQSPGRRDALRFPALQPLKCLAPSTLIYDLCLAEVSTFNFFKQTNHERAGHHISG
jgi:hypothetical protein